MPKKENLYHMLMGKTNLASGEEWLPLWIHLKDTAGVMKKLVHIWIPQAVFTASGLSEEKFEKTAIFLAAIHDIGKATSYFQSIITRNYPEKYEELNGYGYRIAREGYVPGKTPHAWAGQWILQRISTEFTLPKGLAEVVAAHHGKPNGDWERDLVKEFPFHFFGVEYGRLKKEGENLVLETIQLWKEAWQKMVEQALKQAGLASIEELPDLTREAQVLLSGLLIVADWIASDTDYFPLISLDDRGESCSYPERIRMAWEKLRFSDQWTSEQNEMDEKMFEERFRLSPNEVQKAVLRIVNGTMEPGIFILEAQMGVGKTEAALGAAEVLASRKQAGGIFFGLPTQATSNGIFDRLCEWGRRISKETEHTIQLAHNAAQLQEGYRELLEQGKSYADLFELEEEGETEDRKANTKKEGGLWANSWFQGSKRALLADFVVGTVDQFLLASLKRKHFMMRHIGLAGKVVIIDECHAYDAYMNQYLDRSLEWMAAYGMPVILLSATLPANRRKELIENYVYAYSKYHLKNRRAKITCLCPGWEKNLQYPLLTWTDGETIGQEVIQQAVVEKRVKISRKNSVPAMIAYLEERLQEGGCACIIANTVKQAQQIYQSCQESMKEVTLLLYHAQFLLPDRVKKEQEILKRMGKNSRDPDRHRLIVIGTQVLEQSLDYDADILVTQLCPMDLLLQRMGRLHRHPKRDNGEEGNSRPTRLKEPECVILQEEGEPYDSGTRAVYKDYLLMRTDKVLEGEIVLPTELPYLVQKVYQEEDDLGLAGEAYQKAVEDHQNDLNKKRGRAGSYLLPPPLRKKGIEDMLHNAEKSSEKVAEASVRDSDGSLEILLMKRDAEGVISFVAKELEGKSLASERLSDQMPDSEQGRKIASQRLRLPHVFTSCWEQKGAVIKELEERNREELPEWQLSSWLRGEQVLLLDENNQARLGEYLLTYSYTKGLEYEKLEDIALERKE